MGSFEQTMAEGTLWAFATVFVFGVGTSLTPCVYPMIPITVSIFGARESTSKLRSFLLATAYVMGIALMYTVLGVLFALAGSASGAGSLLSNPWFVIPLCLFFALMASSMFGLWEIRLPFWLQNKFSGVGGAGYGGAFAMGLVGGILIAPCTGPVLAGILAYVSTSGDVLLGGGLLFTYALGIGVLFWIIAMFAVSLPKSGAWMEAVKSFFGVALLVAALYYLQNVLLPLAEYSSGGALFAIVNTGLLVAGILLGGIHLRFSGGAIKAARKVLGIALLTVGLFGLVNFAMAPGAKLPWVHDEAEALSAAKRSNRPVFIDFWATWCGPCKIMEAEVLTHPAVRKELQRFVLFKVDVSKGTERDERLQKKYDAPQLPQLVVLSPGGKVLQRAGKVDTPEEMLAWLRKVP